ncbi:MAG: hypothetical protein JW787_02140 [Sedimentisphaerales bacterium]|nr:hypothetical protein [Sedimentisphaerales bacterium]
MSKSGIYLKYMAIVFSLVLLYGCQAMNAAKVDAISTETNSRTVEDGGTGPFTALMASDSTLATHTIFRPKNLSTFGKKNKLPIIAWGNGACANSPWEHVNFLSEIASYGYLVIAIGPMPAEGQRGAGGGMGGAGSTSSNSQLIDAINWAIAQDSNNTSIYYGKIDTKKIAAAGMSCGGLQAYVAAPDPRVSTVMICNSGIFNTTGEGGTRGGGARGGGMGGMPALTKEHLEKLHTPIIYILGGESDMANPNGMDDFSRIKDLPAFAANMEVGHGGTYGRPHGGEFAKVATAWLQWQLKDDKEAAKMFESEPCGLAQDKNWKVEKKNIK